MNFFSLWINHFLFSSLTSLYSLHLTGIVILTDLNTVVGTFWLGTVWEILHFSATLFQNLS